MPRRVYLSSLKASPAWNAVEESLTSLLGKGVDSLNGFLLANLGEHSAPASLVVTTVVSILNAERWRRSTKHQYRAVLGHSIGEVAAAHAAEMLTLNEALLTCYVRDQDSDPRPLRERSMSGLLRT